jgi:hypothetical protein
VYGITYEKSGAKCFAFNVEDGRANVAGIRLAMGQASARAFWP